MKRVVSVVLAILMVLSIVPFSITASAAAIYMWPVLGDYGISRWNSSYHHGVDIYSKNNDKNPVILSTYDGEVTRIENVCNCTGKTKAYYDSAGNYIGMVTCLTHKNTYGNLVVVKNDNGTTSYYGHLKYDSIKVAVVERVIQGQSLALMGDSGVSTGVHLHFEIRTGSTQSSCIDLKNTSFLPAINTVDTTPPTITNYLAADVNETGFSINAVLNDNVGVTRVNVTVTGPKKTCSYDVAAENGDFSLEVLTEQYGGAGTYSVQLIAYDNRGNNSTVKISNISAKTHTHSYTAQAETTEFLKSAANCTDPDIYYYKCKYCSEKGTATFKSGSALGHTGGTANCVDKAICTRCGTGYGSVNTGNHKSIVKDSAVSATCIAEGKTEGSHCSACSKVIVAQNSIAKTAHKFTNTVAAKYLKTAATCTKKAVYYKSCSVCGTKSTETFSGGSLLSHTYKYTVVKATFTQNGTVVPTCSVCGYKKPTVVVYSPKTVSVSNQTYTGKAIVPKVVVKDTKGNVIDSKYYTVTCTNNTNMGVATAKITFKTRYSGSKTVNFKILPGQVKNLKATPATSTFALSWSKVTGAKYYKVEWTKDGTTWKTVTTVSSTSVTVEYYQSGTKYQFRVTAFDSTGKYKGKASAVLRTQTLCSAPSVTLTSSKSKTATVSWSAVTGAKGYSVWYSYDNKTWTKKTVTTTSYTISSLTSGKKLYVKVKAQNSYDLYGSFSNVKSVTVK